MHRINKSVVFITLALFLGQSFAALQSSCELLNHTGSNTESTYFTTDDIHRDASIAHRFNQHMDKAFYVIDHPDVQPNCDKNNTGCHCSLGGCSIYFLPTTASVLYYKTGYFLQFPADMYSDYPPALISRPPITV